MFLSSAKSICLLKSFSFHIPIHEQTQIFTKIVIDEIPIYKYDRNKNGKCKIKQKQNTLHYCVLKQPVSLFVV